MVLAALAVGVLALVWWTFAALDVAPSSTCAPTPALIPADVEGPRTATPVMDSTAVPMEGASPAIPSQTPLSVSRVIDLARNRTAADKSQLYIFRCDGTIDLYLVAPDNERVESIVALGPGDVIMRSIPPASSMGHYPPLDNPAPTSPPEATGGASEAYPVSGVTAGEASVPATWPPYP